jgi:putative DNA primase/helicase
MKTMPDDDRFMSAERIVNDAPEENTFGETEKQTVARLAALDAFNYDRERESEAARLGVRASVLDKQVAKARARVEANDIDVDDFLTDPEPWPESVDGADLLDRITHIAEMYLVMPKGAAAAMALWIIHAHAHDCFVISPVLSFTSPTPECGKTTGLTYVGALVPRACPSSNITTAAIFRAVEKWRPTLLIDEADTFIKNSDEMRGVLNSGHQRANAFVIRTVGDDHEPRRFRTWAPKAVALIGKLPATLASRAINIELRRKTADENVKPLRTDRLGHLEPLRRQAARWVADNATALRSADPVMSDSMSGRAADNWRPLIAIADIAGGEWPARARRIAQELGGRRSEQTANIMLLEDMQRIFTDDSIDRIPSQELAAKLAKMEHRPWVEWRNEKPITPRQIAKLLEQFKVKPDTIRTVSGTAKGYLLQDLTDAFARYTTDRSVTPEHINNINALRPDESVTLSVDVTDGNMKKSNNYKARYGVTDKKSPLARNEHVLARSPQSDRLCGGCGEVGEPDDDLLEAWVGSHKSWLHRRCLPALTEVNSHRNLRQKWDDR